MTEFEWDNHAENMTLLLRLIGRKRYDEPVGRCCVELAQGGQKFIDEVKANEK